jgi:anti-sigma B factor antagonist
MTYEVRRNGTEVRLLAEGDIDMHVAPELRKVLRQIVAEKPSLVIVDLAKVPFVDSSGIATLVEALKLLRQGTSSLRVENCQEPVRDTFDIAGLTKILGIP